MVCPFRVAKDMWNEWTVSIGIRRRKIYPLIFCNIFLVIILCMLLWKYEKTNMHSHNMSFNYEICHWSHSQKMKCRSQEQTRDQNLESFVFWNVGSAQVESGIQHLESGIHRVESRISYCPGVPYMGCNVIEIIMEIMEIMDHK